MAIQRVEGYFVGSKAYRNNNPGNLRASPLASKIDGGMAVFPDYYTGLVAMLRDLWGKSTGHTSSGLSGKSTLAELIYVWAPPNENEPSSYLKAVVGSTGFGATTLLRDLL